MPERPYPCCGFLTVPADTVVTAYGALGLTETHTNRHGTVQRWFNADGSLRKVTWQPKNGANPGSWVDQVEYTYDSTGARTKLTHNGDQITYTYSNNSGDLSSMVVRFAADGVDRTFGFAWDQLGRRREITYPIVIQGVAMKVSFAYDALGVLRRLESSHPDTINANGLRFTMRHEKVDPLGRILHQSMECPEALPTNGPCEAPTSDLIRYSVQGWLVRQGLDSMRYDASGNLVWRNLPIGYEQFANAQPGGYVSNRLGSRTEVVNQVTNTYPYYSFDEDGARSCEGLCTTQSYPQDRSYWYDALGRLSGWWSPQGGTWNTTDGCYYDPLGNMGKPCEVPHWMAFDGANVIGTIGAGFTPSDHNSTTWSFVHGPGTDDPLIGLYRSGASPNWFRILYWVTDGQGRQLALADADGKRNSGDIGIGEVYAGGATNAYTFEASRGEGTDLLGNPTQLSFFRNRAYDQQTGRWTQEDPVGVAGGTNLYQFNGNNPASYTDPFGLCPEFITGKPCSNAVAIAVGFVPVLGDAVDVAGAIAGKDLLTGERITGLGVAATLVGTLAGSGKLAREGVSRLVKDAIDNPGGWKAVGTFTEAAINKKAKGGLSIQTIVENDAGDRLVRHTVVDKAGNVLDDHYRPTYKPRDVDGP